MSTTILSKLLDKGTWQARLFTGSWQAGSSEQDVLEPATGQSLGRIGMADAALVAGSAAAASVAQTVWAALPYDERAAVLRRAAQLAESHFDEIVEWVMRESGSTRFKAEFETSVTVKALHEAAGLPSRSAGDVLPSVPGRLSLGAARLALSVSSRRSTSRGI